MRLLSYGEEIRGQFEALGDGGGGKVERVEERLLRLVELLFERVRCTERGARARARSLVKSARPSGTGHRSGFRGIFLRRSRRRRRRRQSRDSRAISSHEPRDASIKITEIKVDHARSLPLRRADAISCCVVFSCTRARARAASFPLVLFRSGGDYTLKSSRQ